MAWRDNLRDASFKGASFKVDSSSYTVGRRTQVNQYVNRELPFVDDHGREADSFSITAYIMQRPDNDFDYFSERDFLISKLKRKGPGILIHPFYGFKRVVLVGTASISESFDRGGIATFTMNFVEAGKKPVAKKLFNFLAKVDDVFNIASDKVGDFFNTVYSVSTVFSGVTKNAILNTLNTVQTSVSEIMNIPTRVKSEITKNIRILKNEVLAVGGAATNAIDTFNALKSSTANMMVMAGAGATVQKELSTIRGTPASEDLVANDKSNNNFVNSFSITDIVIGGETGVYSGVTRGDIVKLDGTSVPGVVGKSIIDSMIDLINNFNTDNFKSIPLEQQNNVTMIFDTLFFLMIGNAARIAIRTDFASQEEIVIYREKVMAAFDDLLIRLGDEASEGASSVNIGTGTESIWNQDIFVSVEDLRDTFSDGMTNKIDEIANTIDYEPLKEGDNIIVAAYNQYEDLDRATDIYDRNKDAIRNPAFISPTETLRILDE